MKVFFLRILVILKKYLTHQKHEYFLNKFEFKKHKSFFILKFYKDNSDVNYIIMDHFGSENIRSKLPKLLNAAEQNKLIFLSQKKLIELILKY